MNSKWNNITATMGGNGAGTGKEKTAMRRLMNLGAVLLVWSTLMLSGCTSGDGGSLGTTTGGGSGGGGTTTGATVGTIDLTGPSSLVATGASSNAALSSGSLQLTVKDTSGNLMANQAVSLVLSGGSLSGSNPVTTDINGAATVGFTAPTTLGQVTVYAASGSKQSNTHNIVITNGPPATIAAFPAQSKVGPDTDVNILVVVKDLRGNPVPNQSITAQLLAAADNESGAASTFLFASGGGNPVTDSRGEVTVVYHSGPTAGTTASPVTDTITFDTGVTSVTITKDITVEQSAVTVADLEFTSPATTLTANGTSRAKLTVLAVDANGKGVAGDVLSFETDNGQLDVDTAAGGGALTLAGATDSLGKAVVYLVAPGTVGTARVTVESASGFYKYVDFTFVAGSPDSVAVTAAPNTLGPTETSELLFKVTDVSGNPVAGATLTLQLTTNATSAKLSASNVVTDQFGEVKATYTAGAKSGTDILTVTSQNGRSNTATLTVTSNAVTVSRVTMTSDKTTLTADGSSSAFVTVAVRDVNNKPAVGKVVTLTAAGGTFTPDADPATAGVQAQTNINGEALVNYVAGTTIGEYTQKVDCDGVQSTLPLTLKAGLPTQMDVFFTPTNLNPAGAEPVTSGRTAKMYAKLKDVNNNVVSGMSVNFDFAAGANNSEATLSATSADTDFSGVASVTYTAGKISGGDDTVTITVGGVSGNLTVHVDALPVGTISLAGPATLMADGADTANPDSAKGTIYVTVKDTAGNVLPNQNVTFASVGGGLFTPATAVTTDSYGLAAVTYEAPAGLGEVLLSATVGLVRSSDLAIEIVNGPPKQIQVYPLDDQLGPGGETEVVVLVTDDLGYPVPDKTILINVTTNASGVTIPYLGAVTTDSSGLARVTYKAGSGTGVDRITASSGTVSNAAPGVAITVTQSQTEITSFTMTTNRTDLVADGIDYAKLTVKVIDNQDRGVSGIVLNFAVDNGNLDGDVNVVGVSGPTYSASTNANGEVVVYLIAPASVGKGEVTVRAATGDFASQKFNFIPGVPDTVTLTPTPNAVGPSGTSLLKATVVDASGNAVPDALLTFKISSNTTGATLSSLTATTDLFGEAEVTYTAGPKSGTDTVTVLSDNNKSPASPPTISVAPNTVTVGSVTLAAARTSLAADGGDTTTLTATVIDIAGKPAVGKTVTFAVPTGTLSPDGDAVAVDAQGTTDIDGKVNISYRAGIVAGITEASATCDGVVAKVNLQLKAGAVASVSAGFNVATTTTTKTFNKGEPGTVYVKLTDNNGNPVSGEMVTFTFLAGGNNSGAVLGATSALTDASGIAAVNYTAGTSAGTDTLTVTTTNNLTDSVTMTVAATSVTVASIEVGQSAIFIPTLNTDSPAILVRTLDINGQPVANASISFTSTGSAMPGQYPATTDALGMATFKVSDGVAENATVTVTSGTVSKTVNVYSGGTVQLVRSALSAVADGSSQINVTALFHDFRGNRMINLPVSADAFVDINGNGSFDAGDALSGARVTPVEATSDEQGQAVFAVTSTKAETVTLLIGGKTTIVTFNPGPAARIDISSATAQPLSLNGSAVIDATVYDTNGNPVEAGTIVNFTSTFGSINASLGTDANGDVAATFRPGTRSGLATINATSGSASDSLTISVSPQTAGTLEVAAIDPADGTIHVLGTAGNQTARVTFSVKDGAGNLVTDDTNVTIAIPATSALGGGEALSVDGVTFGSSVTGKTVNGQVAVTVRAGRNPGSLGVLASVTVGATTVSTMARVTIVGGQPDSRHISIAAQYLNMAGGVTFGLQDTITAFLGDRFGNVPLDGTPVSFYSECGTIGDSTGFTALTVHGQAVTHHHTQNPTTNNLAGVGGSGNVGLCTIMIATQGSEYFEDNNGNGSYDAGIDTCSGDQGEPFVDGNGNGSYEIGEFYVDIDNSGGYTPPNLGCDANTTIWTSTEIMMSGYVESLVPRDLGTNLPITTFSIPVGGSQDIYFDLEDIFGNALVAGTTVKVTSDAGTLGGTTDYVMPDFAGTGGQVVFSLFSDVSADAKQKVAKVTMSITPPTEGGQGNNGAGQTVTMAGYINVPSAAGTAPVKSVTVTSGAASLVANNAASTVIRAVVKDINDNPAVGVNVTFATSLGTIVAGPVITDSYGIAEAQLTAGAVAGTATAAATSGGISGTIDVPFVAGPATAVSLVAKPDTVKPGTKSVLTATVTDANGNPIKDKTVVFGFAADNTLATLSATSGKTDEIGMTTVEYTAGYSLQNPTEADVVQATVAGIPVDTATITVDPSTVVIKTVAVSAERTTLTADNNDDTTLYIVVTGEDGKPAPQMPVSLTAVTGSFNATSLTTDANGQASTTFTAGSDAREFEISAVSRGIAGVVKMTQVAGPPASVILISSPSSVVPNGTSTLTARVLDANGNPVVKHNVAFTVQTDNTSASLDSSSGETDAKGETTVKYTAGGSLSATSEVDTIRATSSNGITGNANITVSTSAMQVSKVAVAAAAPQVTAGGGAAGTTSVWATVYGADDKPASGVEVRFTTTKGSITATPVVTDLTGTATATLVSGTSMGSAEVVATAAGVAGKTTVTYLAGVPVAPTVIIAPNPVTPDTKASVTARVVDANNNPVSGSTVSFAITTNNTVAYLASTSAVTNADGIATVEYSAGSALTANSEIDTVTATTSNGLTGTANVEVSTKAMVVVTVAAQADTATLVADGNATTTIRATVQGRPPGSGSSWTALSGANVYFTPTSGTIVEAQPVVTGLDGIATVTLRSSTSAGAVKVTATSGGVSGATDVAYIAGPATQVSLNANPSTVAPRGVSTIQATLLDANSNPVVGRTVTFDLPTNNSSASLSAPSAITGVDGVATLTYTGGWLLIASSATDTVRATPDVGPVVTTPLVVTSTGMVLQSITVTADKTSLTANGADSTTLTAKVIDKDGNPAPGVSVAFAPLNGSVSATPVVTDGNGVATTTLTSDTAAGTEIVTVTASGLSTTTSLTYVPGAVATVTLAAAPTTVKPGGTTTLTATVKDGNGNPVVGQTVTFAASTNNTDGTFGTPTLTNAAGEATVVYTAGLDLQAASETDNLTATASTITSAVQNIVVDSNAVVVGSVTLSAANSSLLANQAETTVMTATVKQVNGSPAAGIQVFFTVNDNTLGTVTPGATDAPAYVITDSSGIAQAVFKTKALAGNAVVTATAKGVAKTTNITLIAGTPTKAVVAAAPSAVRPGGAATLTATVTDTNGNAVAGEVVTFLFSQNDSGAVMTTVTAVTGTDGVATVPYTAGDTAGGSDIVTVKVGSLLPAAITPATISVSGSVNPVNSVELATGRGSLPADGTSTTTLRATVIGIDGDPVAGATVTFTTTMGTLSAASMTTDANGVAEVTLAAGTVSGSATVVASCSGFAGVQSITFTTQAPASITVQGTPSTVKSGGTASIDVIVKDANGNPITGEVISFYFENPADNVTGSSIGGNSVGSGGAVTNEAGVARFGYTGGIVNGTDTITVRALSNGLTATGTVTVDSSAKVINGIDLSVGDATPAIGGSTVVRAIVKDTSGTVLPGVTVNFATSRGTLSAASDVTDQYGMAEVTLTIGALVTPGPLTLTASAGGFSDTLEIDVVAGAASAVTVTATPSTVVPGSGSIIKATVKSGSNPVSGATVSFAVTTNNSGGSLAAATAVTNIWGEATVNYTSGTVSAVSDTITATTTNNISGTATVTTSLAELKLKEIGVQAGSASIVANGTSTSVIRAILTDINGNTAPSGVTVDFVTTAGSLSAASATTNSSGIAEITLTSPSVIGTALVRASAKGYTASTTVSFVAGSVTSVDLLVVNTPITVGNSSTLTAVVKDTNGNPVSGEKLRFTIDNNGDLGGSFSNNQPVTDSAGRIEITYDAEPSVTAGAYIITATTANGINDTATLTINAAVVPGPTTQTLGSIALSAVTPSIRANGSTTPLRATVTDTTGAAISGENVVFTTTLGSLVDASGVVIAAPVTIATDSSGNAEVYLKSGTVPGLAYVTAVTGGYGAEATVTFSAGPADTGNSAITANPSTILADGTSTSEIVVTLADANNNPVANGTQVTLLATGGGTITSANPATTVSGRATFTLKAATSSGTGNLSIAEIAGVTGSITYGLSAASSGEPANILVTTTQSNIAVAGVGKTDSTTISIQIVDSLGQAINETIWGANNTAKVEILAAPNGGESISGLDAAATTVIGSVTTPIDIITSGGSTTLNLQAGTLPGVVEVRVTAYDSTGTLLDGSGGTAAVRASVPIVTISSGPAHTIVLSHPITNSIEDLNSASPSAPGFYRRVGTAVVTDRYGNSVADGTVINFGLVDSVIAEGTDGATTVGDPTLTSAAPDLADGSATTLSTASITRNGVARKIQVNDRILIVDAEAEDKSRHVGSPLTVTATTLDMQRDFQNTAANLDYIVGASLLGGYISGVASDGTTLVTGQGITVNGLARFYVTYPANSAGIMTGCAPYRDTRTVPMGGARVYVSASASDDSATTVNLGDFCFAPIAGYAISTSTATVSSTSQVTIQVRDGGDTVPVPFVGVSVPVVVTDRGTYDACTDGTSPTQTVCEEQNGTCTGAAGATKAICEAGGGIWTATESWVTYTSDFNVNAYVNLMSADATTDLDGDGSNDAAFAGVAATACLPNNDIDGDGDNDINNSYLVSIGNIGGGACAEYVYPYTLEGGAAAVSIIVTGNNTVSGDTATVGVVSGDGSSSISVEIP